MNEKKIRQLNILMVIVAIVCGVFVALFSFVFSPKSKNRISGVSLKSLNDNWIVKSYDSDEISDMPISVKAKAGETTVLVHVVPDDVTSDSVLVFQTKFQNVIVTINDRTIYSNGIIDDQKLLKSAVPCMNVVELSDAKPGQKICIYIASAYNKYSGKLSAVYYGTKGDVVSSLVYSNVFSLVVSLILFVISIVLLISLLFVNKDKNNKRRSMYAYIFVATTAVWNLLGNPIMQLVSGNTFGIYMTHMTLMLVLPIIYIMLQRCFAVKARYAKIFEIGIYLFSINFLTGVIFQMLGICDFATYSIFTGVLIIIGLILLSIIMFLAADAYNDDAIYYNFQTNTILLVACILEGVLSFFRFYAAFDGIVLQIGLLIILVLLMIRVGKDVIVQIDKENQEVIDNAEKEKLLITKQINTAFIYSSLNHTMNEIKDTNKEQGKLIYNTSVYLKYNIKAANEKKIVPFSEELAYIKAYLNIIKETKNINVTIEDKVVDFKVPFNTIEPLVENAVTNGSLKATANGKIVVRCYERLDCYAIQIVDNGKGIGPDKKFTGIQDYHTIKSRLKQGCKAGIEINSRADRGTIVTVLIPKAGYIVYEE